MAVGNLIKELQGKVQSCEHAVWNFGFVYRSYRVMVQNKRVLLCLEYVGLHCTKTFLAPYVLFSSFGEI